jgi:ABC-type antimicrobial peptide transport system permease subunit
VVDGALAEARLLARLVAVFALVALGLAVVGVYGVLSFAVERRRREMGVRQAMGARPSSLLRLVLVEGLAAVGLGIGLGAVVAWGAVPRLAARLGGLSPTHLADDPLVWLGVPALLLAVAAVACAVPAWRAARVAPAELSRHS